MFTAKLAAGALAIALLAMSAPSSPSSAAPGVRPGRPRCLEPRRPGSRSCVTAAAAASAQAAATAGFLAGFPRAATAAFSSRGMSPRIGGGNRAMRFNGGGSRKFDGGGSRRFGRGHGVPREGIHINPRYARDHGHHHHHHHKHRRHRFPGYAFYGAAPYFDDWDSGDACEDLYENAMATGSAYWWNLYYDCRDGD